MQIFHVGNGFINIGSIKVYIKTFLILAISLVIISALWFVSNEHFRQYLLSEKRQIAYNELVLKSNLFSNASETRLSLIYGLESYTNSRLVEDLDFSNFETFADGLYSNVNGIRSLNISPDGTTRYVYPFEENKRVIGFSLINDDRPQVREDVQRAITTQMPVISGPYELRQKGLGIVIRKAIYNNNEFWGLVSIVADMKPIYATAELSSNSDQAYFAIRNEYGLFYGKASVFESEPVKNTIVLFGNKFEFAAILPGGWEAAIL